MRFSIIVPVYNIENYIDKCIESILGQTYNDYEILIIDDGSTDNSLEKCSELSKKCTKIKVIHQKNGGLSNARNTGIKIAQGEYLMFLDGDDFLKDKECLKNISIRLDQTDHPDVLQYKMIYYYEQNNNFIELKEIDNIVCNKNSKVEFLNTMISNGTFSVSACDKIVKRELVINNNLLFNEEITSEDIDWSLKLYLHVDTIVTLSMPIYVYRQSRMGSITYNPNKKSINSIKYIIEFWTKFNYQDIKIKEIYLNYLAYQYTILLTIINKKNCDKNLKKEIYSYKYLLQYDRNYKVKLCNRIYKIFDIKLGTYILKQYLFLKNKGIIKL